MLFEKIDDEPEKIRLKDLKFKGFKWVTLYKGSKIDLSEDYGLRLGLKPVKKKADPKDEKQSEEKKESKESKPNAKAKSKPKAKAKSTVKKQDKPDPKEEEAERYRKKLESVNGIGKKTAKDLIQVYPTEKDLKQALKKGLDAPIRDDLAKLLKRKFRGLFGR